MFSKKEVAAVVGELNELLGLDPLLEYPSDTFDEDLVEALELLEQSDVQDLSSLAKRVLWKYCPGHAKKINCPDPSKPRAAVKGQNLPKSRKEADEQRLQKVGSTEAVPAPRPSPVPFRKKGKQGVIRTMLQILIEEGPLTHKELLERLAKKFPDRNTMSMMTTIRLNVRPGTGFAVRLDDGTYMATSLAKEKVADAKLSEKK